MIVKQESHLRVTFLFWLRDEFQAYCTINLQA